MIKSEVLFIYTDAGLCEYVCVCSYECF